MYMLFERAEMKQPPSNLRCPHVIVHYSIPFLAFHDHNCFSKAAFVHWAVQF